MKDLSAYYCLLPYDNKHEIPELVENLISRDISFGLSCITPQFSEGGISGFLFRIPDFEVEKLPKDNKGHYLGDKDSGHSISRMTLEMVRRYEV